MTFLLPLQLFCLVAFPQQQQPGVFRVGGGVTPPVPITRVEPEFTELARDAGYQGTVLMQLIVDPEGQVKDPRVVKPVGLGLDEEALKAVQQWKFRPGMKDGQPVSVFAQIEVTFRLLPGSGDSSWMASASTSQDRAQQARLGKAFYWGAGVTQDYEEALHWLQQAAAQDESSAENYLGMMYSQGKGVAKNSVEATRWFQKAAEQNNSLAQENLGKAYMSGDGLPVDFVQAHLWLSLAARNSAQAAKVRNELAAKMSAGEIESAQALLQKWQPRSSTR
jgi:TonB family protein